MYKVYADGELLFSPILSDEGYGVINPKVYMDMNKAGSISFVLPPVHPFYDRLKKLKTIVTVYRDDERLFRGRVLSLETDFYKRRTVYCEGDLAFLNDSVIRPYTFTGTAEGLFRSIIGQHNSQVDEDARFTIGVVDIEGSVDMKQTEYASTMSTLTSMIESFGGYITTREANGTQVIDYRQEAQYNSTQAIEFGSNMLDLKQLVTAEDVFTVLIPLGAQKKDSSGCLTVESVNDDLDYIEDEYASQLFGRIWKTQEWSDVTDAKTLLEKGWEYLSKGIESAMTLKVNAIDLNFIDDEKDRIGIGRMIRVKSHPHGIDAELMCTSVTIDLVNPDKNSYSFGKVENTATGVMASTKEETKKNTSSGGHTKGKQDNDEETYNTEFERTKTNIKLLAWGTTKQGTLTHDNMASINMTNDEILAEVSQIDLDDTLGVVNQMKTSISQTAEGFTSKVSKNGVISAINQTAEEITIEASKINLKGYVTATQLDAVKASIQNLTTGVTTASILKTSVLNVGGRASSGWKRVTATDGEIYYFLCGGD